MASERTQTRAGEPSRAPGERGDGDVEDARLAAEHRPRRAPARAPTERPAGRTSSTLRPARLPLAVAEEPLERGVDGGDPPLLVGRGDRGRRAGDDVLVELLQAAVAARPAPPARRRGARGRRRGRRRRGRSRGARRPRPRAGRAPRGRRRAKRPRRRPESASGAMVRKPARRIRATAAVGRSVKARRERRVVRVAASGGSSSGGIGSPPSRVGGVEPAVGTGEEERRPRDAEPAHDAFREERADLGEAARDGRGRGRARGGPPVRRSARRTGPARGAVERPRRTGKNVRAMRSPAPASTRPRPYGIPGRTIAEVDDLRQREEAGAEERGAEERHGLPREDLDVPEPVAGQRREE